MQKLFLVVCFLCFGVLTFAQTEPTELIVARRDFLDTKILKNGVLLKPKQAKDLFYNTKSYPSLKKYNFSKYLMYAGVPCVLGGTYLSYDAIRGTRMSVVENGQELVYYERPIFQLIGGIAVFTVGICLIEYNNEFKATAVTLYNNKVKTTKDIKVKVGLMPSGKVGLYASF